MTIPLMSVVWATLIVTIAFLLREPFRVAKQQAVSYEAALEAAKLMKDWGSWMTTVSTAVIGANGFLLTSPSSGIASMPLVRDTWWAFCSVLLFGLSIAVAAWVLGALPSVVTRLNKDGPVPENDIYEMPFFSFIPVRVGVMASLQHVFFVLGLYCFALFVIGASRSLAI